MPPHQPQPIDNVHSLHVDSELHPRGGGGVVAVELLLLLLGQYSLRATKPPGHVAFVDAGWQVPVAWHHPHGPGAVLPDAHVLQVLYWHAGAPLLRTASEPVAAATAIASASVNNVAV